jgi:hypothetical protein
LDFNYQEWAFRGIEPFGNDFVVIEGSFDGTGDHQYGISARKGRVVLHKLDSIGTSWLLTPNDAFDGAWGSAWLYAGMHKT